MVVGKIYLAYINVCFDEDNKMRYGKFVKKAFVYPDSVITDRYKDLFTGETYYSTLHDTYIGEMYINFKMGLVPLCNYQCLDMKFYENLSEEVIKSRILRKQNEIIGDNINECK